MNSGPTLRAYHPSDRAGVEAVCIATGLSGRLPDLYCDAELFAKIWLSPFLEGEPDSCWVVEDQGRIVGYLVGSARPGFMARAIWCLWPYLGKALGRWARGSYRHHPPSGRFLRWLCLRSWQETPSAPPGAGNFHFNLLPEYQGRGTLGADLGHQFLNHLRQKGVSWFYIHVFVAHWLRGYGFYRRLGFRTYDLRPCSLYGDDSALGCFTQPVPPAGLEQVRQPRPSTRLSVVIPCRADGEVLTLMLKSLARQWHRPDEVIVVRDGPDAACEAVTLASGIRCARVIAGDWGHAGRARNAGIAAATGDVVIVADADACLAPELGAQVVAAYERGARWGMPRLASDDASWLAARWVGAMNLAARLLPLPYGTCLFATRELLVAVGGYHPTLSWGEDTEIGLRLARVAGCHRIRAAATYSSRRFRGRDGRELGLRIGRALGAVGRVLRAARRPRGPLDPAVALGLPPESSSDS